jgi:CRP-like cAMP-binding protein
MLRELSWSRSYAQGDPSDSVCYLQEGQVRFTVVSRAGKEATLGILSEGEFFGEGGMAGQPLRTGSATAMTDCEAELVGARFAFMAEQSMGQGTLPRFLPL